MRTQTNEKRIAMMLLTFTALWLLGGCGEGVASSDGKSTELANAIPSLPGRTGAGTDDTMGQAGVRPGEGDGQRDPGASGDDSAVSGPPLEAPITIAIQTVSACATSDLDMVLALVAHDSTQPFIATLETGDGVVLASATLDPKALTTPQLTAAHGRELETLHQAQLVIPGKLRAQREIEVSLFACIDTNRDNKCGDEKVKTMAVLSGLLTLNLSLGLTRDLASDVVYFAPTRATIEGNQVSFTRVVNAAEVSQESQTVMNALNNLVPKSESPTPTGGTINTSNPLTIRLAIHAALDTACHESNSGSTTGGTCYSCGINTANFPTSRSDVRTNGCFVAGTRTKLPGGSVIPVEQVAAGFSLLRPDGSSAPVLRVVAGPEPDPIVDIRTDNGQRLRVTQKHPMVTERGLRKARDLKVGDRLFTGAGKPVAIRSLRLTPYRGQVYNFELQGVLQEAHQVIAEDLLTGDLHLQEQLSR